MNLSTLHALDLAYLLECCINLEELTSETFDRLDRLAVEGPWATGPRCRAIQGKLAEILLDLESLTDAIEPAYRIENPIK